MQRISIALVGICASFAACAHRSRVPPLTEVQDQEPIRWPLRQLAPLPAHERIGALHLDLSPSGELNVRRDDGPFFRYRPDRSTRDAGTSLDRGYAKRFAWIEEGALERYVELFRGSPIVSIFPRVHRGPVETHSFEISDRLTEMISFDRHEPVIGSTRTVALDPRHTEKPIVVLRAPDDSEGVVFFFPHRPEIRRWYLEDYVVTGTVSAEIEATRSSVKVRFPAISVPAWSRTSFDFPIYVMPYRGRAEEAIDQFRIGDAVDYWEPRPGEDVPLELRSTGLRMLRYFPAEFASWLDASPYAYGHANGFAWGNTTAAMKGIRTDPLSPRALHRDHAFRMLTFFVEAGRKKGAPPNLMMHPQWTNQMEDPNEIRTIVFCQYWEYRLDEFERLFDSPHLTKAEKLEVYRDLQAAKRVFDPDRNGFAKRTPNGGVWFDYLDLPISEELDWIVNTHTTNLGNVGRFALLARKMDDEHGYRWWRELFLAGLDGLDYALAQEWMWHRRDPNELRYAKGSEDGPRDYHYFMLTAWIPQVATLSAELAPDRTPALLELQRRLFEAKLIRDDATMLQRSRRAVTELETKLRSR